jgi:hypothetical protein
MDVNGFHWTRVTGKQLRILYEVITSAAPPSRMGELAAAIDTNFDARARSNAPAPHQVAVCDG